MLSMLMAPASLRPRRGCWKSHGWQARASSKDLQLMNPDPRVQRCRAAQHAHEARRASDWSRWQPAFPTAPETTPDPRGWGTLCPPCRSFVASLPPSLNARAMPSKPLPFSQDRHHPRNCSRIVARSFSLMGVYGFALIRFYLQTTFRPRTGLGGLSSLRGPVRIELLQRLTGG